MGKKYDIQSKRDRIANIIRERLDPDETTKMMSKHQRVDSDDDPNQAAAHSEDVSIAMSDESDSESSKSSGSHKKPMANVQVVDEDEVRYLRLLLKLFFYNAFKWKGYTCSLHLIKSAVFLLQSIKVLLITLQLFNFGADRQSFTAIVNRGHTTLRHNLLQNWDASFETLPYPPAHGEFASYNKADLSSRINEAVERFYNIEHYSNGYFTRLPGDAMTISLKLFDIDGFQGHTVNTEDGLSVDGITFPINEGLMETIEPSSNRTVFSFDVDALFKIQNVSEPFSRLLWLILDFKLHSVSLFEDAYEAVCLEIEGKIRFRDKYSKGQVVVSLNTFTTRISCGQFNFTITDWDRRIFDGPMAVAVLIFSSISLIWTAIFVAFGIYVLIFTKRFMKSNFRKYYEPVDPLESDLPWQEYTHFFRFWDVSSGTGDVLTICGTAYWLADLRWTNKELYLGYLDKFSIVLGIGGLLAWLSLLRFLNVHRKFSLLFDTFGRAFINAMAYIVVVTCVFLGFWLCGYVVLSPYHIKFRKPGKTAETLFSFMFGDEMYTTLNSLETEKTGGRLIWLFSRFYLWTYMSVFTIVVINLLVAIVLGAYENARAYSQGTGEDICLGPMERAMRTLVKSSKKNRFRESIYDLLSGEHEVTNEELALRNLLSNLFRVSKSERDIKMVRPRTLKAFMEEEEELKSFSFLCTTCSFVNMKLRWFK